MLDPLVRRLEGAEIDAYFRMSAPGPVPGVQVPDWQTETLTAPWRRPEQLRGAFHGGELLGGYIIHERWLRIGRAWLLTGCIGNVFVGPEHRRRGVASAMMREAIEFAEANRHALLLLDGITGFYGKFGYADVFDPTWHAFKRELVLDQPSPYAVRPAMREDAAPLLELYRRHVGAFDRTLEEQGWRLPHGGVAVDRDGAVRGYMHPPSGDGKERVGEVAADDWSAGLALSRHHASLSEAEELRWAIPPRASRPFGAISSQPWTDCSRPAASGSRLPTASERRIALMSTETRFTVADLGRMHLQPLDDTRYEIIDGELHVATQPSLRHQAVCAEVIVALRSWDPRHVHGRAFFAPGVIFAEDDTAAPDVAWIRRERFAGMADDRGHLRVAPDLVVEVLSPGRENVRRDREKKLDQYSRFGVREYWIVDWRSETADVHRHDGTALRLTATLHADDRLTSPLLPGFSARVGDLCAPPA